MSYGPNEPTFRITDTLPPDTTILQEVATRTPIQDPYVPRLNRKQRRMLTSRWKKVQKRVSAK